MRKSNSPLTPVALLAAACLLAPLVGCPRRQGGSAPTGAASPPDPTGRSLTLLTWNVKADPCHDELRYPALLKALGEAQADVIALQEARPSFIAAVKQEPWAADYHVTEHEDEVVRYRGDYIVSRFPIEKLTAVALPSRVGRGAVIARMRVAGRRLAVATAHLESRLEHGAIRADQLDRVFALLTDADDAVFMADFNFGDAAQPETKHLNADYADLWPALRPCDTGFQPVPHGQDAHATPTQPGLTWDIEHNPLARDGSFPGEPSRRLDRILVRSPVWRPKAVHLIGDRPIARVNGEDVFASDHYGVVGVLERAE